MNAEQIRNRFEENTPDVPDSFHFALCTTLETIAAQERGEAVLPAPKHVRRVPSRRHGLAAALIAALLLATAAYAATHWHLFDSLSFMTGENPRNADAVMHANLAHETVNGVDIDITEAGYDGRTLFIRYTYTMPDVAEPLGDFVDGVLDEGVSEEDMKLLSGHNVGWWIDHLWIDGMCVDMPGDSGSVMSGSANPGELVQTEYWRLDNVGLYLSGKVEIALPIGERQSLNDYRLSEHPEAYGEDGTLLKPDKGLVSFTLDTNDMLSRVTVEHPNIPTVTDTVTAQVSEVCYSPLMTYITLALEGNEEAIAAYKAENGEGFLDENGNLLWPYSGMDVYGPWIGCLQLVDGDGNIIFPDTCGYNGGGDTSAEFIYPYIEIVPKELYLAYVSDETGAVDMDQIIRVK